MVASQEVPHPDVQRLRDFVFGKLDDDQVDQIAEHLEVCEVCMSRVEAEPTSDRFVALVCQAERARAADSTRPQTMSTAATPCHPQILASPSTVAPSVSIEGYELLEELGRGGMGVVYRANHLGLKRQVALKVILSGEHSTEVDRQRFRSEAETIARLRHPGIVQIYEIGEHAGRLYVALELIEGVSLRQMIGNQPQDSQWSAEIVMKLARTAQYAHQEGVIHRDLKPENVLLSSVHGHRSLAIHPATHSTEQETTGDPKITDFGLAKKVNSTSDLTKSGMIAGTLAYMAPEQIGGRPAEVGPGSDIYALGVILYELLTGRTPFRSSDTFALVTMIRSDDPLAVRARRKGVPRDLETICLKCLRKDPLSRYNTAQELADDLQRFLHGEPIQAQGLGPGRRLMQWARRRPFLAAAYSCSFLFYALHLFCMCVLRLPAHQGAFHWTVTGLLTAWCAAVTALQPWQSNRRMNLPVRYLHAAITTMVVTVGVTADCGPRSAPIPVFLLLIPASLFLLPRPFMIWFVTTLSLVAYGSVTAYAYWFRPDCLVSAEQAIAFAMSLVMMGLLIHLTIRRQRLTA